MTSSIEIRFSWPCLRDHRSGEGKPPGSTATASCNILHSQRPEMSGLRAQTRAGQPIRSNGCTMPSAFWSHPESLVNAGFESWAVKLLLVRVGTGGLIERRSIQTSAQTFQTTEAIPCPKHLRCYQ